jgi:hypothetical protein
VTYPSFESSPAPIVPPALPIGGAAEGPAAEEHGARLFHAVGMGRHAGAHPSRALRRDTGALGAQGKHHGRDHRQPERQSRSKGIALEPCAG